MIGGRKASILSKFKEELNKNKSTIIDPHNTTGNHSSIRGIVKVSRRI